MTDNQSPSELAPDPVEMAAVLIAQSFQTSGYKLDTHGAMAMIVLAYTTFFMNDVSQDVVSEYCLGVWKAVESQISSVQALYAAQTPTASTPVGTSVH